MALPRAVPRDHCDPVCQRRAAVFLVIGALDLSPEPGAPAPGARVVCFRYQGSEVGCPVCAEPGSQLWTCGSRRFGRRRPGPPCVEGTIGAVAAEKAERWAASRGPARPSVRCAIGLFPMSDQSANWAVLPRRSWRCWPVACGCRCLLGRGIGRLRRTTASKSRPSSQQPGATVQFTIGYIVVGAAQMRRPNGPACPDAIP